MGNRWLTPTTILYNKNLNSNSAQVQYTSLHITLHHFDKGVRLFSCVCIRRNIWVLPVFLETAILLVISVLKMDLFKQIKFLP